MVVVAGDDVLLADLLGPPAQFRHPVLDRAHGQTFRLPSLHQALDVLGLEACCSHVPVAQFLKLVGHQVEHALAIALGRVAAVAVAPAQLLQFVVQVSHSLLLSVPFCSVGCPGVSVRCRWCVVVRSVFLSVPNAWALRELQGTRDTTPVLCRGLSAGRRGTRHWHRWRLLLQVGSSG